MAPMPDLRALPAAQRLAAMAAWLDDNEVAYVARPAADVPHHRPRVLLLPAQARLAAVVRRTQLPLVHAWALTINRSQGQTLDRILLDLRHAPFSRVHVAADCGVFVNDRCCIEQQGAKYARL